MTAIKRTVPITVAWIGKVFIAGLIAGAAGYLPEFLYPSDVVYGWLREFVIPVSLCAIPSWIGAIFGRVWLSNLVAGAMVVLLVAGARNWPAAGFVLVSAGLAAGTMSFLASRWELFELKPQWIGRISG